MVGDPSLALPQGHPAASFLPLGAGLWLSQEGSLAISATWDQISLRPPLPGGLHVQWLILLPLEELAVYFSLSYSNRFTKSVNILLCEVRGTISKCLMGNGSDPRSLGAV